MRSQYAALRCEGTHVLGLVTLVTSQEMLGSNTVLGLVVGSVSDSRLKKGLSPISTFLQNITITILWFNILPVYSSIFYEFSVLLFTSPQFNLKQNHGSMVQHYMIHAKCQVMVKYFPFQGCSTKIPKFSSSQQEFLHTGEVGFIIEVTDRIFIKYKDNLVYSPSGHIYRTQLANVFFQ